MGNPVLHFEVVGKDAQALQDFYGEAFGWRMEPAMPSYAMAYPGVEGGINGGIGAAMDGGPGHVTFYVDVEDLDATLATVERLGGRRVVGLTEAGSGQARADR